MKLIVQPDHGVEPVISAISRARTSIEVVIFRLDVKDVTLALEAAVTRGVAVRALIAHTNKGGEKQLRKLEMRLLAAGVTVSRSAEEWLRYHSKMMVIDGRQLHVNGFNFTWLDIDRSRSFGAITTSPRLVKEAQRLFAADCDRQPYVSSCDRLVVSPETSRTVLGEFLAGARRQLCIYDPDVSDPRMVRLLADRLRAGVDVRIIGKASTRLAVPALRCPAHRLHVRAIIRDGARAFLGSQSLRTLELDKRREVGIVITERAAVRGMLAVFEADWALASAAADVLSRGDSGGEGGNDAPTTNGESAA
jgi:cardiolipin synthase A/B